MVYILFLMGFMISVFNGAMDQASPSVLGSMGIIIPLHLFSMFCIVYCMYFAAKTFKTVELQRNVSFSDFAGEFFLIWFFPIGVWIIQPKINKIMYQHSSADESA